MRFCLLTDETRDAFDPSGYFINREWDYVTVDDPVDGYVNWLSRLPRYDVYFNIYEGYEEDEYSGPRFLEALEELDLPFTGAESIFYNITREEMQTAAQDHQLGFARGFRALSHTDLQGVDSLAFPLIVKHPNSYASTGLTRESRVNTPGELEAQFEKVFAEYGSARVEEFIEGRELSCLVVENANEPGKPFAYPPAEVLFPEGETFLHESAKWDDWGVYVVPVKDETLSVRVMDISRRFFLATGGNGYARVDMRVRSDGEIVILEINPNCGILYGPDDRSHTDLPISWDPGGHDGFLDRVFRSAAKRWVRKTEGTKRPGD